MRFLHTADWHLGKTLRGRDRLPEQRQALGQLLAAAVEHQVDAVLLAGDVYDSSTPPPEAEQAAYGFLAELCRAGIPCVLIAGNHDHPRKLSALQGLLENLRIHVRAEVKGPDQGGIVTLEGRNGRERALVATLPFVPERKIVDTTAIVERADGHGRYGERIAQVLDHLATGFRGDTVNLVLAHLLVSGSRFGTGEKKLHLGEIYGVDPSRLPASAHYTALGHLHRPQEIPGAPCRAAYAGSLIELDFGEREQDKRAVLVEARPGRPATLTDVPLTAGRRLRDVRGTPASLEQQKADLGDAFLRVMVDVPEPTPGIEDKIRALLPHAVEVTAAWPRRADDAAAPKARSNDPTELFAAFYRREHETDLPDALRELFVQIHREAGQP